MNRFFEILKEKTVLVADGAWGTEIQKDKNSEGIFPELLNIHNPQIIENIARAYIEAGADIILTNTFGGNLFKLRKYRAEDKFEQINIKGVEISKKVAGDKLVFASVGPTGELLQPYGNMTEKDAQNCYYQQIEILSDAGADGIVIETMSDINEAKCALVAARSITDKTVVVCFTFNQGSNGYKTLMGNSIQQCVSMSKEYGANLIGSNCGSGIEHFIQITKELKNLSNLPVWVKPNAGVPRLVSGKTVYPDSPEYMAGFIPNLITSGASVIGGCCGTTPLHIRKIAQEISRFIAKK